MNKDLADKLRMMLMEASPYDTGQLKASIQEAQLIGNTWVITIGTGTTMTRKIPSNVYASITNNAKELHIQVGKRGESNLRKIVKNPNYHWINKTVEQWAKVYGRQIAIDIEEEE